MRRFLACLGAAAIALGVGAMPVAAQDEVEGYRLTLAECLRTALANNLDLFSARFDPQVAEQQVSAQRSAFDPSLNAGVQHSESKQEVFNIASLSSNQNDGGQVGVSTLFKYGADLSVTLSGGRSQVAGALVTLDTNYGASLAINYNMPLLNGFGLQVTTEQLVLARGNLEISREDLRRQAHVTMQSVESAYWNLAAAQRALDVARARLDRAKDLLDLNRKKVEVGTLAPIEVTQAEAGVASKEEAVIVAEVTLQDAEDELRRLMAVPENDPLWSTPVLAVDEPRFEARTIDVQAAIDTAMEERPELASMRQSLRNNELSERVAKKNLLPGLDLAAAVTPSGNNFTTDPGPDMIFGTPDDGAVASGALTESLKEIPDFKSYDWSVGLRFSYPIGNRRAKAAHAIARINTQRSEVNLRNQEQSIRVDVRRAARNVESGIKRVDAARENVRLQREKLDAEQKKFQNGMSTSFEVLTFQDDLADAELALIRAGVDYTNAITALEVAKGTLLQTRGLSLSP